MKIKTILSGICMAAAVMMAAACQQSGKSGIQFPEGGECFTAPDGSTVEIACIFHGSVAIRHNDYVIQIDPVMQLGDKSIDYSAFGKADAIFVTHEHPDHLNAAAIEALSGEMTQLFANAGSLEALGLCAKEEEGCCEETCKGEGEEKCCCEQDNLVTALGNGDCGELTAEISYVATAAYNTTPGREMMHPMGHGNGYLFTIAGLKIYVAGDTEPIEEMQALGEEGIDIALLPVNQPFTMTVEQCIEAAKVLKPKTLIPYHMGDTDMQAIAEGLKDSGIEVRLREELR